MDACRKINTRQQAARATLVHESIHATSPDLAEAAVERIEESVVAAVWPHLSEICDDMIE